MKKDFTDDESARRHIISLANIILYDSKRVIFALHRGDIKKAEEQFTVIENIFKKLEKFGFKRIAAEGAYKAGAEEYVEAKALYLILTNGKISEFKGITLGYESYLGGLCDLTGELVRRAINEAATGNLEEVAKIKKIINNIMAELVEIDMTGYLRTKYDQAKRNLNKIEQIDYEVKIRK